MITDTGGVKMKLDYDIEKLEEVADDFYHATGIGIFIIGEDFTDVKAKSTRWNPYCAMIRNAPGGRDRCKISDNELCRDWDPTDPNPANPWHTYVAGEEEVIDPETDLPAEGEESTPVEGEHPPVSEGEDTAETPAETPEGEQSETEGTEPPVAEETPAEGDVTEGTEGAAGETAEETPAENTAEDSEALPSAA
jgi:hypothetical protein